MIKFGWETFKKRPWFFVGAACIFMIAQMVLQAVVSIPVIGSIVSVIGGVYVGMGVLRLSLRAHDSVADASFGVLWNAMSFWRYLGATLLKGLITTGPITVGGIVVAISAVVAGISFPVTDFSQISAFVIPVLIVGVLALAWLVYARARLTFVEYLVLDAGKGPMEAVKDSFRITQWSVGKLVLFMFALGILNILGALALLVGLLVTIPVSILATAHLYRTFYAAAPTPVVPLAPAAPDSPAPIV